MPGWDLVRRAAGKLGGNLRLLVNDPEQFGRNLSQLTNPALFERRLLDVMHATPMHVRFDCNLSGPPRLNVLDSAWNRLGMTGGPNTVVNLAARIAQRGVSVRLVSTTQPNGLDLSWLRRHVAALTGREDANISLGSASSQDMPLDLGPRDGFLATHWTTAHQLREVLPLLPIKQFFYMLQEFEPGFYPWSSNYARASETYGMDFWPVVNQALLADFLFAQPLGRLSDPEIRNRAVIFEPALDAALFHPPSPDMPGRPKRLLFYARPTNTRNMFGLGLLALRSVAGRTEFDKWEFVAIGSRGGVPNLALGSRRALRRAAWMEYAEYGDVLRQADVLLCPMFSPHTSYPVLEMAACGGLSVTNVFATKTKSALEALSPNIIAVQPSVSGFAEGLLQAAAIINRAAPRIPSVKVAHDWGAALDPPAQQIAAIFENLARSS